MLAITSGWSEFLILAAAGVVGAFVLGIGRAGMGLMRTKQTQARQDEADQRILTEFFFDTPRDPRTGTPAKEGWTTKVDRSLKQLADSQARIERAVHLTLSEVVPDSNGGHNLRGAVDRSEANAEEMRRVHRKTTDD